MPVAPDAAALAMTRSIKCTAFTQYGLRTLRNTKTELEWRETAAALSEFSERMRDSGYAEKFLHEILQGWDKKVEAQNSGKRPINRRRSWKEKGNSPDFYTAAEGWARGPPPLVPTIGAAPAMVPPLLSMTKDSGVFQETKALERRRRLSARTAVGRGGWA